ncbi:MAG: ABC transporter permease [Firmicutes bacterium]|nr:ABC transporter permease [Bacillota bacterium]
MQKKNWQGKHPPSSYSLWAGIHPQTRKAIPYLLLLLAWQLMATLVWTLRGIPFPNPGETILHFFRLLWGSPLLGSSIFLHVGVSLSRWLLGFTLAALLGIGVGIITGWFAYLDTIITPLLTLLQPIPSLAWIPVAILLLGLGFTSTVFIIILAAFFPIAVTTSSGIKNVDPILIQAARMLGAKNYTILIRVALPASLPQILSGLRVGLANGWRALIAAEMVAGTGSGLGFAIYQSRWNLDYPSAFACISLIALTGLLVEGFVFTTMEERTIKRWGGSTREVK